MKYMLGANYWAKRWGTEMWLHYDGKEIRKEMKQLSEWGIRCLRVFPNWRDFQPVDRAYAWQGVHGEYISSRTGEAVYGDGVDGEQIENFRDFCHAAEENGIELVVSIVTGWMSGKLFVPPVLNGKNLISDAEALMWMRRFIHRFVRELKNERSIVVWDLGNECNCLGAAKDQYEAYKWTSTVVDAIRSEDTSRPISSGMHGLSSGNGDIWQIEHQGELCDILTTHPYPSPTVGGDVEPYTRLRMTYLPTAQSFYYSGVAGKPTYIQESGCFSETIGNKQMSAEFMRIQILSSVSNGLPGYQWWCAWEQDHLDFPPYSWSMIERQLGLFDSNNEPKPVAYVMRDMSALLDRIPNPFPKRMSDGVCILSRGQNQQNVAIATQILGKQAGLDLDVVYSENGNIPISNLYFLPAISGWQVLFKRSWDTVIERVRNGATLYISYLGGQLTDFPTVVGATSNGVMANSRHSFKIAEDDIEYWGKEILLSPTSAEVLIANESGNPILMRNKVGKGEVFFTNFAPEVLSFDTPDGFNKLPYFKIYELVAQKTLEKKIVRTAHRELGVTINPSENGCLVTVLNYGDVAIVPEITIDKDYRIEEILYGSLECIPACDGVIFKLKKA